MQTKRMYRQLTEVQDISRQLAEALNRDDQVTVQLLLSMRGEPLTGLKQTKTALKELWGDLPTPDAQRLRELLNGEPPKTEEEKPLSAQVLTNRRLWEQVMALDEVLNGKIARDQSIYKRRTSAR